uniref:tRNA uridine(34) hydroxylase N-terminal domain-containing protein n=1 Tax=Rhizophora mucronata TaxID=61149 RepID=A0A2P2JIM8_RHIMU
MRRHCCAHRSVGFSAKITISDYVNASHQSVFQFRQINFRSLTCLTNNPIRLVPESLEPKLKKKNKRKKTWSFNCVISLLPQCEFPEASNEFVVVNFYRFVFIKDPQTEVAKHLSFLKGRDIHGRIYLNEQGINAQYSGPFSDVLAYVEWVKEDSRFSDILVQISSSLNGHAFPRLKLRYKPSLVQARQSSLLLICPCYFKFHWSVQFLSFVVLFIISYLFC